MTKSRNVCNFTKTCISLRRQLCSTACEKVSGPMQIFTNQPSELQKHHETKPENFRTFFKKTNVNGTGVQVLSSTDLLIVYGYHLSYSSILTQQFYPMLRR